THHQFKKKEEKRIHGRYKKTNQRRTQEIQTHRPQEDQSGKAEEATRLRARIEKAQSEKDGSRTGQTLKRAESRERRAVASPLGQADEQVVEKLGFVSGRRFSDAASRLL
ncbi:MAG: hypothetical protein WA172_11415, partial [Terriglobales bacterium]